MELAKNLIFLVFGVCFCLTEISGSSIDLSCRTHNGTDGDCMPIKNCQSLYAIAMKDELQEADVILLRRSKCGVAKNIHYVCCPKMGNNSTERAQVIDISCQTPNGLSGECKAIQSCHTLLSLVTKPDRTQTETNFLKSSQCGYVNKYYMVCCPTTKIVTKEQVETTTTAALAPDSCQSLSGALGDCVPIHNCTHLLNLATNPERTTEDTEILRKSQCGHGRRNMLVCCPKPITHSEYQIEDKTSQRNMEATEAHSLSSEQTSESDAEIVNEKIYSTTLDKGTLPTEQECGRTTLTNRIYGGTETSMDEYPWTALLLYINNHDELNFFCGGSLINHHFILTAAHCVEEDDLPQGWFLTGVRLGEWNLTTITDCERTNNKRPFCAPAHRDFDVNEILIHSQYNIRTKVNDIALIRLADRVEYTNFISPICLPTTIAQQTNEYVGMAVQIAGWGATEKRTNSEVKMKATVKVLNNAECEGRDERGKLQTLSDKQICAVGDEGVDSCHGDSGGPLMLLDKRTNRTTYDLIGLVSYGTGECGKRGTRGVYTRIVGYLDWIKYTIEK